MQPVRCSTPLESVTVSTHSLYPLPTALDLCQDAGSGSTDARPTLRDSVLSRDKSDGVVKADSEWHSDWVVKAHALCAYRRTKD